LSPLRATSIVICSTTAQTFLGLTSLNANDTHVATPSFSSQVSYGQTITDVLL